MIEEVADGSANVIKRKKGKVCQKQNKNMSRAKQWLLKLDKLFSFFLSREENQIEK